MKPTYRFRPGCCIPAALPPFFISVLMSIYRYIYIYIPTIYNNAETRICYPPRYPPFSPNIHITYTLKPCTYRVSINPRSKYSTDARKLSPAFPAQHGTLILIKTTTNAPSITSRVLCCSSHAPPPLVSTRLLYLELQLDALPPGRERHGRLGPPVPGRAESRDYATPSRRGQ